MGAEKREVKDVMSQFEQSEVLEETGNEPTVENEAELIAALYPESYVE